MYSRLYTGTVTHRRSLPVVNRFRYRLFMLYLDLDELPSLFDPFWLWSARRPAPAWFRRADYLGDPQRPLADCVRERIQQALGWAPQGPIRLLTHLRYLGHNFNPVSFYYCFDEPDGPVRVIVAEITNTPWQQRHAYILPLDQATAGRTAAVRGSLGPDGRADLGSCPGPQPGAVPGHDTAGGRADPLAGPAPALEKGALPQSSCRGALTQRRGTTTR